jgi:hypothetical protein
VQSPRVPLAAATNTCLKFDFGFIRNTAVELRNFEFEVGGE